MFCIQCEQTIRTPLANGCMYSQGMCGKTAETADLQDVLVKWLQGLSFWALLGRKYQIIDNEIDRFSTEALFSTLTNVNFDSKSIENYIQRCKNYITSLHQRIDNAIKNANDAYPVLTKAALLTIGEDAPLSYIPEMAVNFKEAQDSEDTISLNLLGQYGIKGAAAYLEHAQALGQSNEEIFQKYHELMSRLGDDREHKLENLLSISMDIGQLNLKIMELLDLAETTRFGHPQPTKLRTTPIKGKCILVSGHDLNDLEHILEQTEGKGLNVYTHGEMLPAHGYPGLKKYQHLVGNFGTAWQNQQTEFADFPGAIIMTSNCLIDPNVGQYADRLFTRGMVGWSGVKHIDNQDYSAVIEKALTLPGFTEDAKEHFTMTGFAHNTLMNVAPKVIEEIKAGNIKHFFLVGGCDGDKATRSYYRDFALAAPKDTVVLTLGCAKYRFNMEEFGDINGVPRLIDIGQCNDAFSAIQLAVALAGAFECEVNELPLTLVLSWFEQKAIVILLTLLSLGIKNIYTGPTLPAFLSDNVLKILVEKFALKPTGDANQDLHAILTQAA